MAENNAQALQGWKARFFTIWSGQAFSIVGSALVQFALVWWLTQETGSATILAVASLFALLPQVLLGPFIGALVDRWNRRWIMVIADSGIAAATGVLMFLFSRGVVQPWHIYAILFVRSLGGAFHYPAMSSSTSLMVPGKHLARIAGMNQTLSGIVTIFAPPLGALLISLMRTEHILAIDIFTALVAVLPLLFIDLPQPPRQIAEAAGTVSRTTYWQDLKSGFTYLVRWPGLLGIVLLAMLLNFLLSPSSSLMPLVVTRIFNGGATQLALAESLFGIGVILGGILLSLWGGFKRRINTSLTGVLGIAAGVIMIGLVPASAFYLFLAGNFFMGFAQVLANGPLHAIFQTAVDPDVQGRIFSLIGAGAAAMMPVSMLIAGPVSDLLGIRFWYILGGILCAAATLVAWFIPAIANIENNRKPADRT